MSWLTRVLGMDKEDVKNNQTRAADELRDFDLAVHNKKPYSPESDTRLDKDRPENKAMEAYKDTVMQLAKNADEKIKDPKILNEHLAAYDAAQKKLAETLQAIGVNPKDALNEKTSTHLKDLATSLSQTANPPAPVPAAGAVQQPPKRVTLEDMVSNDKNANEYKAFQQAGMDLRQLTDKKAKNETVSPEEIKKAREAYNAAGAALAATLPETSGKQKFSKDDFLNYLDKRNISFDDNPYIGKVDGLKSARERMAAPATTAPASAAPTVTTPPLEDTSINRQTLLTKAGFDIGKFKDKDGHPTGIDGKFEKVSKQAWHDAKVEIGKIKGVNPDTLKDNDVLQALNDDTTRGKIKEALDKKPHVNIAIDKAKPSAAKTQHHDHGHDHAHKPAAKETHTPETVGGGRGITPASEYHKALDERSQGEKSRTKKIAETLSNIGTVTTIALTGDLNHSESLSPANGKSTPPLQQTTAARG